MSFDPSKFYETIAASQSQPHGTLTPTQAENTRIAYEVMWNTPMAKIDLDCYRLSPVYSNKVSDERLLNECGSVACIAGWLSAHPHFKAQHLYYKEDGPRFNGAYAMDEGSLELFGAMGIFDCSNDRSFASDKRQALERLREHLYRHGCITKKQNSEMRRAESALEREERDNHYAVLQARAITENSDAEET